MKKLNLDNRVIHDDEQLIGILTTSIGYEPSKQFVESTLDRIMVLKEKPGKVYKPLRLPMYLMSVVGLILFMPITFSTSIPIPSLTWLELDHFSINMVTQLDSWYILSTLLLPLALICILWIELGLVKSRHPF